jgi:hypothetical protein
LRPASDREGGAFKKRFHPNSRALVMAARNRRALMELQAKKDYVYFGLPP